MLLDDTDGDGIELMRMFNKEECQKMTLKEFNKLDRLEMCFHNFDKHDFEEVIFIKISERAIYYTRRTNIEDIISRRLKVVDKKKIIYQTINLDRDKRFNELQDFIFNLKMKEYNRTGKI